MVLNLKVHKNSNESLMISKKSLPCQLTIQFRNFRVQCLKWGLFFPPNKYYLFDNTKMTWYLWLIPSDPSDNKESFNFINLGLTLEIYSKEVWYQIERRRLKRLKIYFDCNYFNFPKQISRHCKKHEKYLRFVNQDFRFQQQCTLLSVVVKRAW